MRISPLPFLLNLPPQLLVREPVSPHVVPPKQPPHSAISHRRQHDRAKGNAVPDQVLAVGELLVYLPCLSRKVSSIKSVLLGAECCPSPFWGLD